MNEFVRKTSRPLGRRSRAASGTQRAGSAQSEAPNSETARSNDASGSGTRSAGASTSGKGDPRALHHPAGGVELRRRRVDPDRLRAAVRQLRGEVGGPAAKLHDVETGHVPQR